MLMLKPEVRFGTGDPRPFIAQVVEGAFTKYGYDAVITSGNDSTHMVGSLHGLDRALDFRTRHVTNSEHKAAIVALVKQALPQCDVVFESPGVVGKEHLHVEWDPNKDNTGGLKA